MVSRWMDEECKRCGGTGRVATKGMDTAVLCSCPAGRAIAAPPAIRVFFFPSRMVVRG